MFDNLTIGPGTVINAGITITSKTADPLTLTLAELVDADGGFLTADGFEGDAGLWILSPEKIAYWDALAAAAGGTINGETWTGHWGPGSDLSITDVVVYYPAFAGPNSVVVYIVDPASPSDSLYGTWNMPLRLVTP
jgi:hypothetical protein